MQVMTGGCRDLHMQVMRGGSRLASGRKFSGTKKKLEKSGPKWSKNDPKLVQNAPKMLQNAANGLKIKSLKKRGLTVGKTTFLQRSSKRKWINI